MRPVERMTPFLKEIEKVWKSRVPDWRFGQLMFNFANWLYENYKIDIFFVEEKEFIKKLKEFLHYNE